MSNYTKSTDFTAKDSLPSGDSQKVIRGSEFDTEFSALATAVNSKADKSGDTVVLTAGTVSAPSLTTVSDTNTGIYFPAADEVGVSTGGTERLRVNSSGNLGLGVTPSAWLGVKALQVGTSASFSGGSGFNDAFVASNAFYDGANWKYINTNPAYYASVGGSAAARWYTAPSGTAGNAITFTQAMTLDASGDVNIGATTNPNARRLRVNGKGSGSTWVSITDTAQTANEVLVGQDPTSSLAYFLSSAFGIAFSVNGSERARIDSSGNLLVATTSAPAYTSKMRLQGGLEIHGTQQHNVAPGNTNPYEIVNRSNGGFDFYPTGTTLAARITALGNLLVNTTSDDDSKVRIKRYYSFGAKNTHIFIDGGDISSPSTVFTGGYISQDVLGGVRVEQGATYYGGGPWMTDSVSTTYSAAAFNSGEIRFFTNTGLTAATNFTPTERARITSGGQFLVGLTSSSGWRTSFKAETSGVVGCSLFNVTEAADYPVGCVNEATSGNNQFVWFLTEAAGSSARGSIEYNRGAGLVAYNTTSDYRAKDIIGPVQNPGAAIDALKVYEGKMKDATQSRPMLIAHEAQEHAPYAVSGVKDEINEDGTPKFQQMDVSSLVPLLLAEIQSLRTRVATLENN